MNPIHYRKSPRRKTEKVATPRELGERNAGFLGKFTAWLLSFFYRWWRLDEEEALNQRLADAAAAGAEVMLENPDDAAADDDEEENSGNGRVGGGVALVTFHAQLDSGFLLICSLDAACINQASTV
jgi:hypothetical protein